MIFEDIKPPTAEQMYESGYALPVLGSLDADNRHWRYRNEVFCVPADAKLVLVSLPGIDFKVTFINQIKQEAAKANAART